MKRLDVLIAAGLVGAAVTGTFAAGLLSHSGRLDSTDWTLFPALVNPWWLAAGTILLVVAVVLASASLLALAHAHSGKSVLARLGAIFVLLACLGALGASALDFALIATVQGEGVVVEDIFFMQRWRWWWDLGFLLFVLAGCIGLVAVAIGTARGSPRLRRPGLALAAAAALTLILPIVGVSVLALVMGWLGIAIVRGSALRTTAAPVAQ